MKLALIPCGGTEWHDEGRLLGRVELPLTAAGQKNCRDWARRLKSEGLERILHGSDELATRTAEAVARVLAVPTKAVDELIEVDLGLWTGLTDAELKTRFASAHRELCESPLNVVPPDGESLSAATKRLTASLRKQTRRKAGQTIGVVLRPLSLALMRCALEGRDPTEVWEMMQHAAEPVVLTVELTSRAARAAAPEGPNDG